METDKHQENKFDWLKEYQWQKGQSGNPAGRPKTKTLKEFARDFLASMSEEARIEYLKGVDADVVWKMAEGNPKNDDVVDITTKGEKIESTLTTEVIAIAKQQLKEKLSDDQRGTTTSETGDTVLP